VEWLGYFASILMGLTLGMIGGGGSILTVPILVYLFKVGAVTATAYSLFIVGLTALVGGASYLKKGEVDLKTGFLFAVPSFIGVYITRAYVVPNLPDPVFSIGAISVSKALFIMSVFAILMLAASISMIKGAAPVKNSSSEKVSLSKWARVSIILAEGLVVGAITGFVGAGGGFLIIPALVILVGMPIKVAVGTSLFIISAKSLIGFIGDLQNQSSSSGAQMDWTLLLTVSAIAVVGLFVGISLSKRVPDKVLKKGFGIFVLVMGSLILADQLLRL
jgi:uncharacterized membrane protein YfcA